MLSFNYASGQFITHSVRTERPRSTGHEPLSNCPCIQNKHVLTQKRREKSSGVGYSPPCPTADITLCPEVIVPICIVDAERDHSYHRMLSCHCSSSVKDRQGVKLPHSFSHLPLFWLVAWETISPCRGLTQVGQTFFFGRKYFQVSSQR